MPPAGSIPTETCFLSYARADEHFALRFASDLRSLGVLTWMDQLDIRPSERWDRAIEQAIRTCSSVVVILSPRAVASENVADEISLAIDSGKRVIPVMIEECALPLRMTRMHLIDATNSYQVALDQCLAEIELGSSTCDANAAITADTHCIQDPEIIASATQQLASIIGPIARIFVARAASRATSIEGLYALLALHIHNLTERERFVQLTSEREVPCTSSALRVSSEFATGNKIDRVSLERIGKILTSYLGPIAPLILRRESRLSKSVNDLRRRLAATLRNEHDRADFARRLEA